MRVLIRSYDLDDPGGSGKTLATVAGYLESRGETVLATGAPLSMDEVRHWSPDVIIGQQWATGEATGWATALGRPFVMLVHGAGQYEHFRPQCDLVVFNTVAQRDHALGALGRTPWTVLHPHDEDPNADLEAFHDRLREIAAAGRRRPTLTVCLTVANEAQTLEAAVQSVAAVADAIVIGVDSRSTDGTHAIAARLATRCFEYTETSPPDFPRMRNRAMALVETDWALVLDGHEWIEHADLIPGAIETTAWSVEIQTLYEPDEQRVPGLSFPFPRLHRRHVRFAGAAAHEEVTTPAERRVSRTDIKVWHERKPGAAASTRSAEKSGSELQVLRDAWLQRGDTRALFYLANGLREAQRHGEAIEAYETYLRVSRFPEEAWQARLYLARCRAALGDWSSAQQVFEQAVVLAPERAEAAVGLGHALLAQGDARRAASWFRMATGLPQPADCRMFVEVPLYRWGAWHGLALALDRLGDPAGAAEAELRAVERGAGAWASSNVAWWRARAAGHAVAEGSVVR